MSLRSISTTLQGHIPYRPVSCIPVPISPWRFAEAVSRGPSQFCGLTLLCFIVLYNKILLTFTGQTDSQSVTQTDRPDQTRPDIQMSTDGTGRIISGYHRRAPLEATRRPSPAPTRTPHRTKQYSTTLSQQSFACVNTNPPTEPIVVDNPHTTPSCSYIRSTTKKTKRR